MIYHRVLFFIAVISVLALSATVAGYFESPEEYSRSGKHYTELAPQASSHTGDAEWLYDLAWAYFEDNNYADAERYLRKALEIRPTMAFLNARMGELFAQSGKPDSAIVYYEEALNNHYEYIEVWEKIVVLKPDYYANLGLLYTDKAEENSDPLLLQSADRYLNIYLDRFPDGEYAQQAKTALQRIELRRRQMESRESLDAGTRSIQAEEAKRKADIKADRENFRTEKPWLAGFGFYSVGFDDDHEFIAKNPEDVIDDTLSMKHYATKLNEFGISGGYMTGPFFLRANFHYGSTSSGKNYFWRDPVPYQYDYAIDSSTVPWDSVKTDSTVSTKDDIRPKISAVKTIRLSVAADYNVYYMNPVLLYVGANADVGIASLIEPEDNFESVSLAGAGLGGGIMLRFSDFLFDLSYRRNIVGSSSGGSIVLMGIYKF